MCRWKSGTGRTARIVATVSVGRTAATATTVRSICATTVPVLVRTAAEPVATAAVSPVMDAVSLAVPAASTIVVFVIKSFVRSV